MQGPCWSKLVPNKKRNVGKITTGSPPREEFLCEGCIGNIGGVEAYPRTDGRAVYTHTHTHISLPDVAI